MNKVMSLVAIFAMSAMLVGCYSKACEEPAAPAPMPYKDQPAVTPQEEATPMHHREYRKYHHKHHHHKKHHHNTMKHDEKTADAASNEPTANEPASTNTTTQQ